MSGTCFSPESARAIAVFPVPDGPTSRMPRGGARPHLFRKSRRACAMLEHASSNRFTSLRPPDLQIVDFFQ